MFGLENLIKSVQNKEKPLSEGKNAHNSLEIIIAAHQSVKSKKSVSLPVSDINYKIESK